MEPEAWQRAVDGVHALLPAAGANLQGYQNGTKPQFFFVHQGYDPNYVHRFQQEYAQTNPWVGFIPRMPLGVPHIISESEYLPAVRRSDCHSFACQNGNGYGVGMPIWATPERFFFLVIECSERKAEKISKPAARIAKLLSTHLARAFAINHRLGSAERQQKALASFLERAEAPIIVVDAARRVRFANQAGEHLLATSSLLEHPTMGRVAVTGTAAQAALEEAVRCCTAGRVLTSSPLLIDVDTSSASARIAVIPLAADGSLMRGPGSAFHAAQRLALLLFIPANRAVGDVHALFRESLGLTRAEAELAVALSDGEGLAEYAMRRNVAIATVRNQLQAIYGKTLTHRQGELVALLSRLKRGPAGSRPPS